MRSPEERKAEAQRLHDQGDARPVSQIEQDLAAQDQQEQSGQARQGKASKPGGQ
jgi:hypothetical protein